MAAMEAHFLKSLYDTRSLEASLAFEAKQVISPQLSLSIPKQGLTPIEN